MEEYEKEGKKLPMAVGVAEVSALQQAATGFRAHSMNCNVPTESNRLIQSVLFTTSYALPVALLLPPVGD